jgi:hypothetical protein
LIFAIAQLLFCPFLNPRWVSNPGPCVLTSPTIFALKNGTEAKRGKAIIIFDNFQQKKWPTLRI